MSDATTTILMGDCIDVMPSLPRASVDFVLTDPPYLVNYRSRNGQRIANDISDDWLAPAFREVYRLMKPDTLCVSFYGWQKADRFIAAWHEAGLRIVGHLVFRKRYQSSARYTSARHEQAYLLAKGKPPLPQHPLPDVLDWTYTGNCLHPTQKPVEVLSPIIEAFTQPDALVFDPFCGSASTLVAAQSLGRDGLGIELDETHYRTAAQRLASTGFGLPQLTSHAFTTGGLS